MHLWWAIPGVLAGMAMPFIHPDRRMNGDAALTTYEDDLRVLHDSGIRGVVCLLNIESDENVYRSAGFTFLCLPVADGGAPTQQQFSDFLTFVNACRADQSPVAVHC